LVPKLSDPADKQEFKYRQKKHAEVSHSYVQNILDNVMCVHEGDEEINQKSEEAFMNVIFHSVSEDINSYVI
jgi:hypothetical protein